MDLRPARCRPLASKLFAKLPQQLRIEDRVAPLPADVDEQSRPQVGKFVHPPCERSEERRALAYDERADQYVVPRVSEQFLDYHRCVTALRCLRLGAGPDKLRIDVSGRDLDSGASLRLAFALRFFRPLLQPSRRRNAIAPPPI